MNLNHPYRYEIVLSPQATSNSLDDGLIFARTQVQLVGSGVEVRRARRHLG